MNVKKILIVFSFFIPLVGNSLNLVVTNQDFDTDVKYRNILDNHKIFVVTTNDKHELGSDKWLDFNIPPKGQEASYIIPLCSNRRVHAISGFERTNYAKADGTILSGHNSYPKIDNLNNGSTIHVIITSAAKQPYGINVIFFDKIKKDYEEKQKNRENLTALFLINSLLDIFERK